MRDSNFASLTDYLRVRKGEAEPSPVMLPSQALPFAQRVVPTPADALVPPRPPRRSKQRRKLTAAPTVADVPAPTAADVPAKPRRIIELSANEYDALGLVAVKKGTTPEDLLRKVLRNFLFQFVEQCGDSRY